jgi:putative membrane protein
MIRKILIAGAAALCLAGVSSVGAVLAQPAASPSAAPDSATQSFITQAAQTDEFERREGRLAERRARSAAVRKFAAHMVSAHTKTTQGLKAAIRQAGMTPPPPPPLSEDQTRMLADLARLHGRAFDKAYIDQQVQAHEAALGVVQGYAQTGDVAPIKAAAAKTAPIVQSHLDMAKGLQSKIG